MEFLYHFEGGLSLTKTISKGRYQKHPEGGGPHFLEGVQNIFTLFFGGGGSIDQFKHF